jgi:hypothetical protein
MKRNFALITALIMTIAIFTGCSAAPRSTSDSFAYETTAMTMAATAADGYYGEAYMNEMGYYDEAAGAAAGEAAPIADEIERKLIRNADITIKTLDADKSYAAVSALITELGGYVYTSVIHENEYDHSITVTYKMPPENLQAFCDRAAETENVTNASITANDITTAYYDSAIRLDTLRRSLEKYYEYLENADTADEMLMMQSQIDYITQQIESYEGQIRVWDALTAESEVVVTIIETPDPSRAELEEIRWDDLSWGNVATLMSNGIRSVLYGLLAVFQWLLIFIVTIIPILVIAAIIIVPIVISSKRKKAKAAAKTKETAAAEKPTVDITITDETAGNDLSPYPIEENETKDETGTEKQ